MRLLPEPCVTTVLASLHRDAVDFLETGHTALHLLETRAPQIPHAFLGSLRANLRRAPQGENDAHDRLRDRQHLIDAHPALVAVGAVGTSLGREDLHSGGEIGLGEALLEQGLPRDLQWLLAVTARSEEHTSELQSPDHLVCRLLLEKKKEQQFNLQTDTIC